MVLVIRPSSHQARPQIADHCQSMHIVKASPLKPHACTPLLPASTPRRPRRHIRPRRFRADQRLRPKRGRSPGAGAPGLQAELPGGAEEEDRCAAQGGTRGTGAWWWLLVGVGEGRCCECFWKQERLKLLLRLLLANTILHPHHTHQLSLPCPSLDSRSSWWAT